MATDIQLVNLIKQEKLNKILQGFTEVSGVAAIIADAHGRPITQPHNFTNLCLKYCRSTAEGRRRCYLSDRYGGTESLRIGKSPIYNCLNSGLMDCAAPVVVEGHHLATVLCGQVLEKPQKEDLGLERARQIGIIDIEGYLETLQAVPLMSRERLFDIANLMAVITQTISELALQKHFQQKYSQRYLHKLINSVTDCIVSTSSNGIISLINEAGAAMLGYEAEQLIGKSILSFFPDDNDREIYRSQLEGTPKAGRPIEIRAIRADRERFPVQISVAQINRQSSEQADYVTVMRDISEQIRIQRMKEDFIGMVAHDIKSPVLSIQKALELLLQGGIGSLNEIQAEMMNLALETNHQLFGLVSDLLDIYRRENGQFLLDRSLLDLNALIQESIDHRRLLAHDRRIKIDFQPSFSPCLLEGDQDRLLRTVMNLVENAVKFSPEGSEVHVFSRSVTKANEVDLGQSLETSELTFLSTGGAGVLITVSDQGPGIPKEYHKAVFDKFFTIQMGADRGKKGLGLGLTYCRQVIEAHGGIVWIEAPTFESKDGKTGGCDIQFILPRISSESGQPPEGAEYETTGSGRSG